MIKEGDLVKAKIGSRKILNKYEIPPGTLRIRTIFGVVVSLKGIPYKYYDLNRFELVELFEVDLS